MKGINYYEKYFKVGNWVLFAAGGFNRGEFHTDNYCYYLV